MMDDSLKSASKSLISALHDFLHALQGGEIVSEHPRKPDDYVGPNVHYLLRLVWVYVKFCGQDEVNPYQDELPEDFALRHGVGKEDLKKENFPLPVPMTKIEALKALEDIYIILGEPWKEYSNPCEGAWPRRIRGE
jgi:hypothetical protein